MWTRSCFNMPFYTVTNARHRPRCVRYSMTLYISFLVHIYVRIACRTQWPRGLGSRTVATRLLRLWFRIPPGARMFFCRECCVLSGRYLCDELICRPEESYRLWCVVMCDIETSGMRTSVPALCCTATGKKNYCTLLNRTNYNKQAIQSETGAKVIKTENNLLHSMLTVDGNNYCIRFYGEWRLNNFFSPLIHHTHLKEIFVVQMRSRENWLTERKFRRSHSGDGADPITVA
jgi:hypothetical protein